MGEKNQIDMYQNATGRWEVPDDKFFYKPQGGIVGFGLLFSIMYLLIK